MVKVLNFDVCTYKISTVNTICVIFANFFDSVTYFLLFVRFEYYNFWTRSTEKKQEKNKKLSTEISRYVNRNILFKSRKIITKP